MKKIIIILMLILLSACSGNKPDNPDHVPTEPVIKPEPVEVKEYIYELEPDFIAYEFSFKNERQTYEITDNLTLKFEGEEKEVPYCQDGKCLVYPSVKLNDKPLDILQSSDLYINEQYGSLILYKLNDYVYLLNFNYAAQFNSNKGIVFNSDGTILEEYTDRDLTMNELYQNQFLLSHTDPEDPSKTTYVAYTAEGKNITSEKMDW